MVELVMQEVYDTVSNFRDSDSEDSSDPDVVYVTEETKWLQQQ